MSIVDLAIEPAYITANDVRTYTQNAYLKTLGLDVTVAAVKARGDILFGTPFEGDTVTIDGNTFTFSSTPGADVFATIAELTDLIDALDTVDATDNGLTVRVVAHTAGEDGNAITMSRVVDSDTELVISGATLVGGIDEVNENDDTEMNARIVVAERYIDAYAGYWQRFDLTQDNVFPRDIDLDTSGDTLIPQQVRLAVIAQVEFMFVNMPDTDHGVTEDDLPTMESISPRVKMLMKGYICRTGSIALPWITNVMRVPLPADLSILYHP